MNQLLKFCMPCFLLIACFTSKAQQTSPTDASSRNLNMKGAYSMLRQIANDGTKDSMMNTEQFKIYTDRYMIYVHPKAGDTLAEYGIGLYEIKNGKVMEYVFHNSDSGAVKDTFELNIYKMGNGYKQTIHFPEVEGRRWTLIEDYISVGKNTTTPLDGAWKQTRFTQITPDGKRTNMPKQTQFKVYESGHFIWVRSSMDSAGRQPVSYYGYGSFEMEGNKKYTEINTSSTFRSDLLGVPVSIQLEMLGKDAYRQTITSEDGSKWIEEYTRLK